MLLASRSLPMLFKISAIQSDFPLGPSKTHQPGPRPLEHSPRSLLLGRLAVSPQASLSTCWTPGNSPSRMSLPQIPGQVGACAHLALLLTAMWSLPPGTYCVYYLHMCACVLCSVAQSGLTLCDPLYYSLPGSSVHGDSPGPNTGVGCYAFLQGGLPNPGTELRSTTLQADSSPSEPPGSECVCMCISMFTCLWLEKVCFLEFTITTAVCVPPEVIGWNANCILYIFIKCIYYSEGQGIHVRRQSMGSQWVQQDVVTDQQ